MGCVPTGVGCSLQVPFRHRLGGCPPPFRAAFPIPLGVLGFALGGKFEAGSFEVNEKLHAEVRAILNPKMFASRFGFSVLVVPGGVRRGPPFVPFCLMRLGFRF